MKSGEEDNEIKHLKELLRHMIPLDDPNYEEKLDNLVDNFLNIDLNELPLGKPGDENIIEDDLPW